MNAGHAPVAVRPIPGPLVADLASGSEMARVYELMGTARDERIRADEAVAELASVRAMLRESQRLVELLTERARSSEALRLRAEQALRDRPFAPPAPPEYSVEPEHRAVSLRLPGGAKVYVEAYYRAGWPSSADDPGEEAECWAERVLISTEHGDRLVRVSDLCQVLQDDGAVLRAVEGS